MRLLSALVLTAAALLSACADHTDPNRARDVQLTKAQFNALRDVVAKNYTDPSSVEFRNLRARDNYYKDGTVIRSVCGEIKGQGIVGGEDGFLGFTRNFENGRWVVPVIGQPCW